MPAGDGKGLPVATKDISSNPTGMGVTSPTDPKMKAKDVDQKMRLYQVVEAFRQGRMPSNNQIDETLRWVEHNSPIDESKLSADGRKLTKDFRAIIESARKLVMQKNEDELAQNFIYHTSHVDSTKLNPANSVSTSVSKTDAQRDGEQAAQHLRTLGKLIFTNAEFRKLLKDISYIARDVGADAASKAASKTRPGEEKLNQIDETAPSDRWHGPDGQIHGPNDPAPDTGLAAKKEQALEKKNQAVNAKEQAKAHASDAANRAQNSASKQPADQSRGPGGQAGPSDDQAKAAGSALENKAREVLPEDQQRKADEEARDAARRVDEAIARADGPNTHAPRDGRGFEGYTQAEQNAAKEEGKRTAKDKALSAIPEKHRERVNQNIDDAKSYMRDKIPEERRDRFIYRAKKVIVEQQRHRDYQEAIDFFLGVAETYKGHAQDVKNQSKDHAQGNVRSDPGYTKAELELRTLVERFANNTSLQPTINAIDQIYKDVSNDRELKSWFSDLNKYIRRVLQEPGFVMKDQCDQEGRRLRENSNGLFGERYRPHREELFHQIERFFLAFADDPLNKQFGEEWKTLTKDLLLDSEGNFKYKPHLWSDVRSVILPALLSNVGYVPIPRIEYTDNMLDLVIENLTLESQNIIPNIFEIEARTYHKLSPYSGISDKSKQSVWVSFSQIQADLRDVAFYFKKKSGFPKLSDHGLADVFIGGSGISGKVHLESTDRRESVFHVREVKVKIDTLKFKIRDSKHNILYSTVRPLATGLIKKQVAKAIQDGIRSGLSALDAQLVEIRDRYEAANANEETSRFQAMKQTANEKKAAGQEKAKEADQKSGTFKIVAKRDSKILDWSSPDSIVEKQGQKQDLAGQAPGWRSPAFNIVPGAKADVSAPVKDFDPSKAPSREVDKRAPGDRAHGFGAGAPAAAGAGGAAAAGAAALGSQGHHSSTTGSQGRHSSTTGTGSQGLTSGLGSQGASSGSAGGLANSGTHGLGDVTGGHSSSAGTGSHGSSALPTGSSTAQSGQYAQGAVTGGGVQGGPLGSSAAPGAGQSTINPPNTSSSATTGQSSSSSSGLPPPVGY